VWQPEIDEIARRWTIAHALGGEETVARHHTAGNLTVRERIDRLIDPAACRSTACSPRPRPTTRQAT
jgi:acetyl-CoA carboxylase carboxyltransferase component